MSSILVGTASWTDKTLLESSFYPKQARTAEARLKYYTTRFPIVEVDSTYYFPPTERNSKLWIERSPADFTFHIKAYALLTQHPARPESLYKDLRDSISSEHSGKRRLYLKHLEADAVNEIWKRFRDALMPLHSSGKLGVVHFQFPQWFLPGGASKDYIVDCQRRLNDFRIAIEFRNGAWLNQRNRERTLDFLSERNIALTSVDMPQGFRSSMPPEPFSTSADLAYVRFHGRNTEAWEAKTDIARPRFAYEYSRDELTQWVPKIKLLAEQSKEVHVLMNNCYRDWAVNNASQLVDLL